MLTYLKPGYVYQKNDILETPDNIIVVGTNPGRFIREPGVMLNPASGISVTEDDMPFKPRRWTPDLHDTRSFWN